MLPLLPCAILVGDASLTRAALDLCPMLFVHTGATINGTIAQLNRRLTGGDAAHEGDEDDDLEIEGSGVAANSSKRRSRSRRANGLVGDTEAEQPLMEDEVTRSQAGVQRGEIRAYAHRDIKPG